MQIAMAAQTSADVEAALLDACGRLGGEKGGDAARLDHALALWRRLPDAFATVKHVLRVVDHAPGALSPEQAVARCAAAFDRAAGLSEPASVALYTLGDTDLLEAATREVVRRMEEWALLSSHYTLLDFGCGNGRFLSRLAPRVRFALGLDVSPGMLAAARRSCVSSDNVAFTRTSGCNLSAVGDDSIDLFCAIDTFPYLVQCGGDLAARHFHDAVRVLRPAGSLLLINYSYRGSVEADRDDIARLADEAGLRIERNGTRDFTLWDGVTFLLRKRSA
jgi:SAM-dependent methyltransferase